MQHCGSGLALKVEVLVARVAAAVLFVIIGLGRNLLRMADFGLLDQLSTCFINRILRRSHNRIVCEILKLLLLLYPPNVIFQAIPLLLSLFERPLLLIQLVKFAAVTVLVTGVVLVLVEVFVREDIIVILLLRTGLKFVYFVDLIRL